MRDTTHELVARIEEKASNINMDDHDVVQRARDLWNYESDAQDCDVELKIGSQCDIRSLLEVIEGHEDWMIRWLDTPEASAGSNVNAALIHYESRNVRGQIFL